MLTLQEDILATLSYFDLFRYPLTSKEILLYAPRAYAIDEIEDGLYELCATQRIFRLQEYYSLHNNPALTTRRDEGYNRAIQLLQKAYKAAKLINLFPFVRGIAISGSLSKYYAEVDSDIDFFIITAKDRLWLARTFTHLLKKISYMFRKEHFFCMNYYIDEASLQIPEQNIFTAIEIATLIPLKGSAAFQSFARQNNWIKNYLPNNHMRLTPANNGDSTVIKRIVEYMLNNKAGDSLDNLLMRITSRRWEQKTKQQQLNTHGTIMQMAAGKHFSKPDPTIFQEKIVGSYNRKVMEIKHALNINGSINKTGVLK